jgi:NADH-quinone oxidoreductase subunit M
MNLHRAMPFAAFTFVVAGLASMGLPGFSGFVAELQVLIGAWRAFPTLAVASGVGILVGIAYVIRTIQQSFFGASAGAGAGAVSTLPAAGIWEPISVPERIGAAILMSITLLIGLRPSLLLDLIVPSLNSPLMSHLVKGGPL